MQIQRDWIGSHEQLRADGYPVGSGLVERAGARVINARMKKRGMLWKWASATAVVALQVQCLNAHSGMRRLLSPQLLVELQNAFS